MARIAKFHLPSCDGGGCECLWELDYRPQGLYGPRRRVRFQTRKAAERYLAKTALQAARGDYVEPAEVARFAEVAEDWFRSKTDRRPSHVCDLRARLDQHILPAFGACKIDRVAVVAIEQLRDGLRERGYAYRTINTVTSDCAQWSCASLSEHRFWQSVLGDLEVDKTPAEQPAEALLSRRNPG